MKQASPNPVDAHLGYWLRLVSNQVSHAFQLKVEARGATVAEWVVLRSLFDASTCNPSDIAAQLGMTRGAISKLVDRLVGKKLVKCSVEKGDRRYQSLSLTATGRSLVPTLATLADANDAEFFAPLVASQRSALLANLKEIARIHGFTNVPVE
jgi:DNA-binding MarR family transcriptional regulator